MGLLFIRKNIFLFATVINQLLEETYMLALMYLDGLVQHILHKEGDVLRKNEFPRLLGCLEYWLLYGI